MRKRLGWFWSGILSGFTRSVFREVCCRREVCRTHAIWSRLGRLGSRERGEFWAVGSRCGDLVGRERALKSPPQQRCHFVILFPPTNCKPSGGARSFLMIEHSSTNTGRILAQRQRVPRFRHWKWEKTRRCCVPSGGLCFGSDAKGQCVTFSRLDDLFIYETTLNYPDSAHASFSDDEPRPKRRPQGKEP